MSLPRWQRGDTAGPEGSLTHREVAVGAQHLLGQDHGCLLVATCPGQAQGQGAQADTVQGGFGDRFLLCKAKSDE